MIGTARAATPLPLAVAAALVGLGLAAAAVGTGREAGGERAVKAPLAPKSLLLDASARDGRLVVVGERGHILYSDDGGDSWTQADVPTRVLLTGVFMHDRRQGWAVGHDEVVVRTRDGGSSWQRVHSAPENERPLLDVWFQDERRGVAIGAYGSLLVTGDGGDTWEARPVNGEDDFHLNAIARAADGALYLAAEAGHLYRSDDGGGTWRPLSSPYEGSFFGLLPLSDGSLLAFGLRGRLYRSADRGGTWAKLETGTDATLMAGLDLGSDGFVVGGLAGTLLWNDGAGGPLRRQVLPDRKGIVALARGDDRTLLAFGEGGIQRVEIRR